MIHIFQLSRSSSKKGQEKRDEGKPNISFALISLVNQENTPTFASKLFWFVIRVNGDKHKRLLL